MAKLDELVRFLDTELNTAEIPDYPGALNGLQLENQGDVSKVGAAVDASLPVIEKALELPGFEEDNIEKEITIGFAHNTVLGAADKIVASPNTITGSIGIFGQIPNMGGLLNDKLGITTDVVKTNENADFISLNRALTPYEKQRLTASIAKGYDTFISHVAEGRGMTKEEVDEIGQGRVWSGENAKEIGLIDEFGGLQSAIELAAEMAGLEEYRTVALPSLPNPFEEMFKMGGNNVRARILKNELGINYRYYDYLKKLSERNGIFARMPYDIYIN